MLVSSRVCPAVAAELFAEVFVQAIEEPVRLSDRVFHVVEVFAVVQYLAGGYVEREDEGPEGRHRIVSCGLGDVGYVFVFVFCVCLFMPKSVVILGGCFWCDLFV